MRRGGRDEKRRKGWKREARDGKEKEREGRQRKDTTKEENTNTNLNQVVE